MAEVFCPDQYVNRIRRRKRPLRDILGQEEVHFSTWEEAHKWLVSARERKLSRASLEMDRARRALAKAKSMTPPTGEETR